MKKYAILVIILSTYFTVSAQENYPKIAGYAGIVHPITTFSPAGNDLNFDGHYVVGMPIGINLWKSKKIGFSFEVVSYVRVENGTSKMSNLLIHPGVLVSLGSGFTFAGRLAFETSGRYGFTPVLNKVVIKNKASSFFIALPVPLRFGNDKPFSTTVAFQFGIAF
ncbi:hypothetical protein ACHMWN_11350 [Pedobacter sp. UC225_61]|uniref:hypothetical protein n=1 Tax=Pedobacter sp. UC225_61 TaxID=3374623 RepID=UPI0037A1EE10